MIILESLIHFAKFKLKTRLSIIKHQQTIRIKGIEIKLIKVTRRASIRTMSYSALVVAGFRSQLHS